MSKVTATKAKNKVTKPHLGKPEDRLRGEVMRILEADQSVERVDDKCGGIEFGADLTFIRRDAFGVARHYGVQIKTKNMSATKDAVTESVKEVIAQLAIAFGHSFPPAEKNLDAMYIVTSGKINSFAQEHIKASRVGFREIYFIDGKDLDNAASLLISEGDQYRET